MKHTHYIRFTLVLLFCGLLSSCEEPVELDLVIPAQYLYVSSTMVPDEPVSVRVTSSSNVIVGNIDEPVDNALVEIFVFGNNPVATLPFVEGSDGLYRSDDFRPIPSVTYEVRVVVQDFEPTFAKSTVPPPSIMDSIFLSDIVIEKNGDNVTYTFKLGISFEDPVSSENYYNLRISQERRQFSVHPNGDTSITSSLIEPVEIAASTNHDYKLTRDPGGILFIDNPFIDQEIPVSFTIDGTKEKAGTIYAELRTVSSDYYLYEESIINSSVGFNGGLTSSGSVHSNVEGGGGTVSGYSSNSDSLSLEE